MNVKTPRVSIGLPVFNGENFLAEALDSILGQTFDDFELIISDNASTDRTGEICRLYAAMDSRIIYYRNAVNTGASANFNKVFSLARGYYFKWAAHDDLIEPDFLARAVRVLDREPATVLCYARTEMIDERGKTVQRTGYEFDMNSSSPDPRERFRRLIGKAHWCFQVFGVIRSDVLRKTPLIGDYAGSDRVLLAELSLHGPFHEIQERLYLHRSHSAQSIRAFPLGLRTFWFAPEKRGRLIFPVWRQFAELFGAVGRSPLGRRERTLCYLSIPFRCRNRFKISLMTEPFRALNVWYRQRRLKAPA